MTGHLPEMSEKTRPGIIQSIRDMERMGQPAADFLLLALKDNDKRVKVAAAHALGEIGDTRSYEVLVERLSDPYNAVRFAGAAALGQLGDRRAIEPLERICMDENCFVRIAGREAITRLTE